MKRFVPEAAALDRRRMPHHRTNSEVNQRNLTSQAFTVGESRWWLLSPVSASFSGGQF